MKKSLIAIILALALAFSFAACNGNEPVKVEEDVIIARGISFLESMDNMETMLKTPERFKPVFAEKGGMDKKTVKNFFEHPEEWLVYSYTLSITNMGDETITVYGIDVENNGKNGVYVIADFGAELGLSSNGTGYAAIDVLCSNVELTEDEAKAAVDEMVMNIVYTKAPVENEDGSESVEETKRAAVQTAN